MESMRLGNPSLLKNKINDGSLVKAWIYSA